MDICGPDYARVARSIDAVGGHRAGHVALPATPQAVGDVLRLAAGERLTVRPRGSGSKINWGTPREVVDLLLDTARLNGLWNHDVTAGTVEVATGTPVRALQAALALRGQRLPVDPPSRTATVGGMLAVNESGPLRHRHGPPADHVDRVGYVDLTGTPGESDGEGDRPGLAEIAGVLTSAVLRLQPLPAVRRWVTAPVPSPLQVAKLAAEAATHQADAIEADLPADAPGTISALFEDADAARLAASWGVAPTTVAPPWWGQYPFTRDDIALRVSVAPEDLAATLYTLSDAAGRPVPTRGSAGLGNMHAVLPGDLFPDRVAQIMETLRHVLMARSGRAVLLTAPPSVAARLEMASPHELF